MYIALMYSFPIWNQSLLPCPVLTVASWTAYRLLRRQVMWFGTPISLRICFEFVLGHTLKGFSTVNETEVDGFLGGIPLFFLSSNRCWQFDLWFLSFSKFSLYIWKFLVHVLLNLNSSLKDFEHYLLSMWNKCNPVLDWAFFGVWIGIWPSLGLEWNLTFYSVIIHNSLVNRFLVNISSY